MAVLGLAGTHDRAAQRCYPLSCAFSRTAAVTGSMSRLARKCEISEFAILTEFFGAAFLYLGNQAHLAVLKVESKPIPHRFRR